MKTKSRVFILLGVAAIASVAIAVGFLSQRSLDLEPATVSVTDGASSAAEPVAASTVAPQHFSAEVPPPAAAGVDSAVTSRGAVASEACADSETDLALAQTRFAHGDYVACIEPLQRAAQLDPDCFQVQYLLGLGLRYLGRYEESNTAFDAALEIAPRDARALVNSARTLLELGRPEDAAARVRLALETVPQDADAWNVLGRAHLALGRLAEAEAAFEHACSVDSTHAYAHNNLGLVHLQRGAWGDAVAQFRSAVQSKGDVAAFHNNLGIAYERTGRFAEAAGAYARALELQPSHPLARVALARVNALLQPSLAAASGSRAADSVASRSAERVKP